MPVIMKDNVQYAYTTKGTVFHTLSNAEYEALPESEKMNGDVYCIPDREPILNPDEVWAKIGTGTLDIGDDLTDGVNQLNSSNVIIGLTSTDIFTPASGVTMNTRPCYKRGKEIFFTAVFSMSNPVNTTNTLGTFKDGYKPNTQYYSIGMSYASGVDAGSASLINAGTNGITVEHTGAKAYLVVCAKYITN